MREYRLTKQKPIEPGFYWLREIEYDGTKKDYVATILRLGKDELYIYTSGMQNLKLLDFFIEKRNFEFAKIPKPAERIEHEQFTLLEL